MTLAFFQGHSCIDVKNFGVHFLENFTINLKEILYVATACWFVEAPRWPSGKASASRAEDPGFESRLRRDFFRGRVIPVTSKLALQWLPCQAPGVIGSALGLVGPVSVYCDWVRWIV